MNVKTEAIEKHLATLRRFIEVFCREKHGGDGESLCDDCRDLLQYAQGRLEQCPMDPKPSCKNCTVHCYRPEYRARIQEVMKFSGLYFVKRGWLDWLFKYFLAARGRG